MKNIFKFLLIILFAAFFIISCDEFNQLNAPEISTGSADFTRFVTLGNSLTMAEQSGSVFESSQKYSYGKLIANTVGTTFEQAIFSDPGTGGRIEVKTLEPFETIINPNMGSPTNLTYPAPYNNLGVKGAFLTDILNAHDANSCYTAQFGTPNPLFDAVLRGFGTQLELTLAQQPTFVILFIGNNDILAFSTRGGFFPITPVQQFSDDYNAIVDALDLSGAQVVIANIPDVKSIPFFTTVGPGIGLMLQQLQIPGFVYQSSDMVGIGVATPEDLLNTSVLVLLTGSSATKYLGDVTGAYYFENNIPVPPNVNTAFPFAFAPENPWPNNLILDPTEMGVVDATIQAYNGIIETAASSKGFGFVNLNAFFNTVRAGIEVNGLEFNTRYVSGGFFSLDGVHPTSQGYAIGANEFIKVINIKYNANIPLIDVSTIPGSLVFYEGTSMGKFGIPLIPYSSLDHILF